MFTTIKASGIYFMQNAGLRPSLETFVEQAYQGHGGPVVLRKLKLGHEHALELAGILRRENISRSTLMPSPDNVAKDVCKRWLERGGAAE